MPIQSFEEKTLDRLTALETRFNDLIAQDKSGSGRVTAGAVLFGGANGVPTFDAANLFFDNTNNRLGVGGTPASGAVLDVFGAMRTNTSLIVTSGATSFTTILPQSIEIGQGGSGNRTAFLDLVGDDTYTDFAFRILRGAAGANAATVMTHRGTGTLQIATSEAGTMQFLTANTLRLQLSGAGAIGFFGSGGTTQQTVTGSRGGNAALASLLTALAAYGLIVNSSS